MHCRCCPFCIASNLFGLWLIGLPGNGGSEHTKALALCSDKPAGHTLDSIIFTLARHGWPLSKWFKHHHETGQFSQRQCESHFIALSTWHVHVCSLENHVKQHHPPFPSQLNVVTLIATSTPFIFNSWHHHSLVNYWHLHKIPMWFPCSVISQIITCLWSPRELKKTLLTYGTSFTLDHQLWSIISIISLPSAALINSTFISVSDTCKRDWAQHWCCWLW